MPSPTTRALTAALLGTAALSTLLTTSPSAAADADDPKERVSDGRSQQARVVLAEARDVLEGDQDAPTSPTAGRGATMALRDLVLARDSLTGADRREADRILARPTDGAANDPDAYQAGVPVRSSCAEVCVHWVESSGDAVDGTDADSNFRPDYVDEVVATMEDVHQGFVDAGYREPKADGTLGGSPHPDVYLADIGDDGLYGYCTSDDDTVPPRGPYDAWAYCVLDNDYSQDEFPTNTPLENMRVTAAHEYFHAVQFGYDLLEDAWFMEATATWVEDEMYDDVDDNLGYLKTGPLRYPAVPLDTYGDNFHYGTWIFFRYLTEQLPAESGGMPSLVRDMWDRADAAEGEPDEHSMQAVDSVLRQRGTSLGAMFAAFADANRRPGKTYSEGAANQYPTAPHGSFRKKDKWFVTKFDHLTSATGRFAPEKGFSKLKVVLDLPPKKAGSAAVVTVIGTDGGTRTSTFPLSREGNGSKSYGFAPKSVRAIDVTLVNASAKYICWQNGPYSCQGFATHDDMTGKVRGVLVR